MESTIQKTWVEDSIHNDGVNDRVKPERARRVSTSLRHRPFEFSVATALSPEGRPAGWAG